MKTLILDNKNWQLGSSTDDESDFAGIVGLSPDIKGQNYYQSRGDSLVGQPALVDLTGATLTGNIISGLVDPTSTHDSILISSDGKYYYTSSTTITGFATDTNTGEYVKGQTDLKYFQGSFYATRETDIIKFETNFTTIDYSWWHTTKGKGTLSSIGPHPMEIVEDTLYIADGNKIHTWDNVTAVENQVSLPTGYVITVLKIHTDGRYLKVFATDTYNYLHLDRSISKLFLFDTTTLEFVNEYTLEEQVEGALNFGGDCYCTYGESFGYFTGSGLKLLKKIELSGSTKNPVYYSLISSFNNTVIFPSASYLKAFGDVSGKGSIVFYPLTIPTGSFLHYILPVTNNVCLIQTVNGSGAHVISKADFSTITNIDAQTTKINPGGKVWIRRVDVFVDKMTSGQYFTLYNRQDDGSLVTIGSLVKDDDGAINKKTLFCNVLTDFIQPYVSGGGSPVIKKLNIQYESAE